MNAWVYAFILLPGRTNGNQRGQTLDNLEPVVSLAAGSGAFLGLIEPNHLETVPNATLAAQMEQNRGNSNELLKPCLEGY